MNKKYVFEIHYSKTYHSFLRETNKNKSSKEEETDTTMHRLSSIEMVCYFSRLKV